MSIRDHDDKVEDIEIEILDVGWVVNVTYEDGPNIRKAFIDNSNMLKYVADLSSNPLRVESRLV